MQMETHAMDIYLQITDQMQKELEVVVVGPEEVRLAMQDLDGFQKVMSEIGILDTQSE